MEPPLASSTGVIISLRMVFIRHGGLVELEIGAKEMFEAFDHIFDIGPGRKGKGHIFSLPCIIQWVNVSTKIILRFTDTL